MGFSPQQVGRMTLWQFFACIDGFVTANSPEKPAPPSDEEFERMLTRHGHANG